MSWYHLGQIAGTIIDSCLKSMVFLLKLVGVLTISGVFVAVNSLFYFPLTILWSLAIIAVAFLFRSATKDIDPMGISSLEKKHLE